MRYFIIDANVVLLAGTRIADVPEDQLNCWMKCVEFTHELVAHKDIVVLDDGWEIQKEYMGVKKLIGYPNISDDFLRYVWELQGEHTRCIHLERTGPNEYVPYPSSKELIEFDPPDRKYIALAFVDPEHSPIIEASDSKWWGIRKHLVDNGIQVVFVDEEYIKTKYEQKMNT